MYHGYKLKPLHIILPKAGAYVKGFDRQTKLMYFLIEDDEFLDNLIIFVIRSVLISKKNLIASLSIISIFSKPKKNLIVMKLPIFTIKKFLRWIPIILGS